MFMVKCATCELFTEYTGAVTVCDHCGSTNIVKDEVAEKVVVLSTRANEALLNVYLIKEELGVLDDYALIDEISPMLFFNELPQIEKIVKQYRVSEKLSEAQRKELEGIYILTYSYYHLKE